MFAVEVRDHIMIAHSLPGEVFGPAQKLHGATFIVDVAFFRAELPPDNIVVDIGRALEALNKALAPLNYANLDDDPALAGQVTTTEFLAKTIFDRMAGARRDGWLGPHAADALGMRHPHAEGISRMRVTLSESHVARGWYEADVA
jgi:6-pyruvoyl-tetrahydropterin synthase